MRSKFFGYIMTIVISASAIGASFAATTEAKREGKCFMAIIIDDFGYDGEGTEDILSVDIPLTAAVMPFSEYTAEDAKKGHIYGHGRGRDKAGGEGRL